VGLRGGREGEAGHAGAGGRGQLGLDPVAGGHRVVAGVRGFVAVREGVGRAGVDATGGRQDRDVAVGAATGAGEVGEAETGDGGVVVLVPAAVRAARRVRAPLDHAERRVRAGEVVCCVGGA